MGDQVKDYIIIKDDLLGIIKACGNKVDGPFIRFELIRGS
jgi:hypothetical protein